MVEDARGEETHLLRDTEPRRRFAVLVANFPKCSMRFVPLLGGHLASVAIETQPMRYQHLVLNIRVRYQNPPED